MWLKEDRAKFSAEEQSRIDYPHVRGIGSHFSVVIMSYQGVPFTTHIVRGDSVVREHVYMASIDIHGHELAALQGLEGTIKQHGIDVILVEMIAQNHPSIGRGTLQILVDYGYVLFDFIPIKFCASGAKHLRHPCHIAGGFALHALL